jgi:hypothetical protein
MLWRRHVNVKWGHDWQSSTQSNPFFVGLESDAEPVVKHAQGTIAIAHDRFRHDVLHFLRNHPDIRTIAAVVAEAVVAEPVRQVAKQNDIVLEHDIGPTASTTTSPAAAAATAAEAAASAATEAAAATATYSHATAAAGAGKACAAARGVPLSHSTGANIS